MMYLTEPKINDYIRELSSNAQLAEHEQTVLREMDDYARAYNFPIIGSLAGRVLRQLAMITRAERILELGSGYGYSAVWFIGGMKPEGKIICTDGSEDNKTKALQYFRKLGIESRIDYRVGDALDIIRTLDGSFDIILNDINKKQYPEALKLALPKLRSGGIFITDNVLWSGRILNDNPDQSTKAILEFNRKIFETDGVFSSIIPVRDGLGIVVKQ